MSFSTSSSIQLIKSIGIRSILVVISVFGIIFATNSMVYATPIIILNGPTNQYVLKGSGETTMKETLVTNAFVAGGVAQGWNDDDTSWTYTLPFDFKFYGVTYTSGSLINISSNGYICLDNTSPCDNGGYDFSQPSTGPIIAPFLSDIYTTSDVALAPNNNIYISSTSTSVTFRWHATECCSFTRPVDFSVTIFKNGDIRFDYGDQVGTYSPRIGVSMGDGVHFGASVYNLTGSIHQVPSSLWKIDKYVDPGATYTGTIDPPGSIASAYSGTVDINVVGVYPITYRYSDDDGSIGYATRFVHVVEAFDTTAPVVTLVGSGTITHAHGTTWSDSGATWSDNVDGTGTITTASTGTVNASIAGTYILTYIKADAAGNTGSTTRTITVAAPVVSGGGGGGGGGSSSSYVAPTTTTSTAPIATPSTQATNIVPVITQEKFINTTATPKNTTVISTTTTLKKGTQINVYRTLDNGKKIKVGTTRVINDTIKFTIKQKGKYTFEKK